MAKNKAEAEDDSTPSSRQKAVKKGAAPAKKPVAPAKTSGRSRAAEDPAAAKAKSSAAAKPAKPAVAAKSAKTKHEEKPVKVEEKPVKPKRKESEPELAPVPAPVAKVEAKAEAKPASGVSSRRPAVPAKKLPKRIPRRAEKPEAGEPEEIETDSEPELPPVAPPVKPAAAAAAKKESARQPAVPVAAVPETAKPLQVASAPASLKPEGLVTLADLQAVLDAYDKVALEEFHFTVLPDIDGGKVPPDMHTAICRSAAAVLGLELETYQERWRVATLPLSAWEAMEKRAEPGVSYASLRNLDRTAATSMLRRAAGLPV